MGVRDHKNINCHVRDKLKGDLFPRSGSDMIKLLMFYINLSPWYIFNDQLFYSGPGRINTGRPSLGESTLQQGMVFSDGKWKL